MRVIRGTRKDFLAVLTGLQRIVSYSLCDECHSSSPKVVRSRVVTVESSGSTAQTIARQPHGSRSRCPLHCTELPPVAGAAAVATRTGERRHRDRCVTSATRPASRRERLGQQRARCARPSADGTAAAAVRRGSLARAWGWIARSLRCRHPSRLGRPYVAGGVCAVRSPLAARSRRWKWTAACCAQRIVINLAS